MATEILSVPEEHLAAVIAVIRAGLRATTPHEEVAEQLTRWCDDEEDYLADLAEEEEAVSADYDLIPPCDVRDCGQPAAFAYIGESGDLYLCGDHYEPAPGWVAIPAALEVEGG